MTHATPGEGWDVVRTPAEWVVVEIHRLLFPERYMTEEELCLAGLVVEDGYAQWSSSTAEEVADIISDAACLLPPGLIDLDSLPVSRRPVR